jgi:hypothetical protein
MRTIKSRLALLAAAALVCGVGACGGSVSPANADKIEVGMTERQVTKILGNPKSQTKVGSDTFMNFSKGDFEVIVVLSDGKVTGSRTNK